MAGMMTKAWREQPGEGGEREIDRYAVIVSDLAKAMRCSDIRDYDPGWADDQVIAGYYDPQYLQKFGVSRRQFVRDVFAAI